VVVAGLGPAGAAASIHLARRGMRVVAVDRSGFPRDKCCGDGLTTDALRRIRRLGVAPGDVASWQPVTEIRLRSPSGRRVELSLPGGGTYATVARRADLDAALVDAARTAGAEVREGCRVVGVEADAASVRLQLQGGEELEAPYVIAADGAWSPVRKLLSGGPATEAYLGDWHALRQYFSGVTGPGAGQLWVWFEPDLLPGYAWSFPLPDGRANVGIGLPRRPGQPVGRLGRLFEDVLRRPHVAAVLGPGAGPEAAVRAWPIPARLAGDNLSAAGGRVLFVGDAARAADPLTGEGVGQAIETAELAVTALAAAGPSAPRRAARRYRGAVARGLSVDHRLAAGLSRLLASERGARGALRAAGASRWSRDNFVRWMFEDYPRALALTPWRWRRGALAGPPAYPG